MPDGWAVATSDYLCLAMAYPSGWSHMMGRDASPQGLSNPMTVRVESKDGPALPVAVIYPLAASEDPIPLIGMTVGEIRRANEDIGTRRLSLYEFGVIDDQASFGTRKTQLFFMDVLSKKRSYLVNAIYARADLAGFDVAPLVKRMLMSAVSY